MIVKKLFCQEDLDEYLKEKMNSAKEEVSRIPMDQDIDLSEKATMIYRKSSVRPIILHKDQETTEVIKKRKEDREWKEVGFSMTREVSVYLFSIPYAGDRRLFGCRPSCYYLSLPDGRVNNGALTFEVELKSSKDRLKKEHDRELDNIRFHVENINKQVDGHNTRLKNYLQQEIPRRFREEQKDIEEERELGLPPRKNNTAIVDIPLIEPLINIEYTVVKGEKEKTMLSRRAYEEILEGIRYAAETMERSPGTYSGMDEEDLRQNILMCLNGMLRDRGTAESFNKKGKTDILFTRGNRNLFIAECKKWDGIKYAMDGIRQLEGYLSWGDTKASFIVFYHGKSMTSKVKELKEGIKKYQGFVKQIKDNERGGRYEMIHPEDSGKKYELDVCFFQISSATIDEREIIIVNNNLSMVFDIVEQHS